VCLQGSRQKTIRQCDGISRSALTLRRSVVWDAKPPAVDDVLTLAIMMFGVSKHYRNAP